MRDALPFTVSGIGLLLRSGPVGCTRTRTSEWPQYSNDRPLGSRSPFTTARLASKWTAGARGGSRRTAPCGVAVRLRFLPSAVGFVADSKWPTRRAGSSAFRAAQSSRGLSWRLPGSWKRSTWRAKGLIVNRPNATKRSTQITKARTRVTMMTCISNLLFSCIVVPTLGWRVGANPDHCSAFSLTSGPFLRDRTVS